MTTPLGQVQAFYTAARSADAVGLAKLLHPGFEAHTAPGMPCGAGGAFHGPDEALGRIWGAVYQEFETVPYPETWQETSDGTFVVTGHYRGTARSTGRAYEAEFVHLWRVADDKLSWLHQYTDTTRWNEALTPIERV
ncbi:nuclear transport factor 2 family protein [Actinomadura macrotermitis]|uniref:SnoaL-like domain-containing protein n=1 Tax=Actinomadura macrotermitis TaxID=2585200 RepID=A0A7K0C7Y9_9ACTN|nr:nuclear transport factor 2 family protein [Actinomadura macrotermitis]MQY09579.1 hypothetical protein [Actinomadura macrotermitis]